MKKTISLLLFLGFILPTFAQNPAQAFDDIKEPIMNYDSYKALKILRSGKTNYTSLPYGLHYYNQALATAYTMNCYNSDSILVAEYTGSTGREPQQGTKNVDTIDLSSYKVLPAIDYIINRSKNQAVLMINESHTRAQSRLFLKSILADLYKSGYRSLCVEALNYQPQEYRDIKEIMDSGYYTKEPCYAEIMRRALELGFTIYGYEATLDDYKISNNRDSLQAVHLRDIALSNPESAKMIVYAGHGHIFKSKSRSMYNYFKTLTGITPLTVDQTMYIERSAQIYENPYYIALFNNRPNVNGILVLDGIQSGDADIYTFTPRINYINGRPDYILENDLRKLKKVKVQEPTVLKAYYRDEYAKYAEKCTPVDIIVAEKSGEYFLAIPKRGKFIIIESKLE